MDSNLLSSYKPDIAQSATAHERGREAPAPFADAATTIRITALVLAHNAWVGRAGA